MAALKNSNPKSDLSIHLKPIIRGLLVLQWRRLLIPIHSTLRVCSMAFHTSPQFYSHSQLFVTEARFEFLIHVCTYNQIQIYSKFFRALCQFWRKTILPWRIWVYTGCIRIISTVCEKIASCGFYSTYGTLTKNFMSVCINIVNSFKK